MKAYKVLLMLLEFLKISLMISVLSLLGWGFVDWKFPGLGWLGVFIGTTIALCILAWWYKIFDKKEV